MRQGFSRYGLAVLVTLLLGGIVACGSETETTDRPLAAEPSAKAVPEPEPDAEQDLGALAAACRDGDLEACDELWAAQPQDEELCSFAPRQIPPMPAATV